MWLKAAACVILAAATAMSLLALRQHRIEQMHQMAAYHKEMRQSRQNLWQLQVEIADHLRPDKLRAAVQRTGLELQPVVPLESNPLATNAKSASLEHVDVRE